MNKTLRSRFPPFRDEKSLRAAIESVCAEFGQVTKLRLLRASSRSMPKCACFLQLDSVVAQARLTLHLQVHRFGDDIAFIVDVDRAWTGPNIQ